MRVTTTAFLAGALSLLGCSGLGSFKEIGESVLSAAGIADSRSYLDAGENLLKATQDMTREQEYYLGRAVSAKLLSSYALSKNTELTRYVNLVGQTLVRSSDMPETFGGYHFAVLESSGSNAISAPGGFIFVTSGLVKALPDEDSLAAVLAHEISHVTERHGVKAISQANLRSALAGVAKLGAKLNCAECLDQVTQLLEAAVGDIVKNLLEKGYSREQELEADAGALVILSRAGYPPGALLAALEVQGANAASGGGWLKLHPASDRRVDAVRDSAIMRDAPLPTEPSIPRNRRFKRAVAVS